MIFPSETAPPTEPPGGATSGDSVASVLTTTTEYIHALPEWQGFLVGLLLTGIATGVIGLGSISVAKRVLSRLGGDFDENVFTSLHRPTYLTVFISGLYASGLVLELAPESERLFGQVAATGLIILWVQALWRVGQTLVETERTQRYLDDAFLPIFNNLWKVSLVIATGVGVLTIWGIDITPLLASAGVMGIAVGFAAKDTIANFFGGVALYFDNTYQKGDYIVLDSGDEGTVIDVGIRSTVLLTREGIRITVPNSILNNALVVNESAPQMHRRITVPINVAYGESIEHVREVILEVAESESLVRTQPPARVRFRSMGDFALNLELRCWIDRPSQRVKTVDRLNTELYNRFNKEGIEIPFPQRDLRFRDDVE